MKTNTNCLKKETNRFNGLTHEFLNKLKCKCITLKTHFYFQKYKNIINQVPITIVYFLHFDLNSKFRFQLKNSKQQIENNLRVMKNDGNRSF